MKNEDEKYEQISNLLKMAEEDPDRLLSTISSVLESESDKSLLSHEYIRSARFFAYSKKAINTLQSNKKMDAEIIDIIEKSLIEAKAADDVSDDKQIDYYGSERLNFLAKLLNEVKPGRVQELWGKTKLYYFGDGLSMHEAVNLTWEEIFEGFGNIFFTFPRIVKHAIIMKPSGQKSITLFVSERPEYTQGVITIYRDGKVNVATRTN